MAAPVADASADSSAPSDGSTDAGASSLDLFAVLLGGATALLPVYADQILHVGPSGFGWLRAAPSLGAITMALWVAHRPHGQRDAVGGWG